MSEKMASCYITYFIENFVQCNNEYLHKSYFNRKRLFVHQFKALDVRLPFNLSHLILSNNVLIKKDICGLQIIKEALKSEFNKYDQLICLNYFGTILIAR